MEGGEKILIENNGCFELVNASEVLGLDSSDDIDVTIEQEVCIAPQSFGPTQTGSNLEGPNGPLSAVEPAQIVLKQEDSFQPSNEASAGSIDLTLKPDNELQPCTEVKPAQIDLKLDGNEFEFGSIKAKQNLLPTSPSNQQSVKLQCTFTQPGVATDSERRHSLRTKPSSQPVEADDAGRRKMNDAAFYVWLARKNEAWAAKKKAEQTAQCVSREKRERRAEQSKTAFEVWLARKNQQDQAKESKSSPKLQPVRQSLCPSVFEIWARTKREEHRKKVKKENQRLEQEEAAAKRVDHNITAKVFSRWLQHKTVEAKKIPECRRKPCLVKSKTLKKISATRFEGF